MSETGDKHPAGGSRFITKTVWKPVGSLPEQRNTKLSGNHTAANAFR
jgi:hypothetical protein